MAKLAVINSEYPAGGRLEVYGEEIAGVRSHGDLAGLHRRRKESPMSSLRWTSSATIVGRSGPTV